MHVPSRTIVETLIGEGRLADALAMMDGMLVATPDDADLHFLRGIALLRSEDFQGATAAFSRATSLDGRSPDHWYYLGLARERQGLAHDARGFYERALQIDPSYAPALSKVGRVASSGGPPPPPPSQVVTGMGRPPEADSGAGAYAPVARPAAAMPGAQVAPSDPYAGTQDGSETGERGGLLLRRNRNLRSHGGSLLFAVLFGVLALAADTVARVVGDLSLLAIPDIDAPMRANLAESVSGAVRITAGTLAALLLLKALLSTATTRYDIYERRVDVTRGILIRRHIAVWFYDVTDIEYQQSLLMILLNTGSVVVVFEGPRDIGGTPRGGRSDMVKLVGIGSGRGSHALAEDLRKRVLRERRSVKKQFV